MMKQRVADIDFRQEIRAKLTKQDQTIKEHQDALSKQRQKSQALESQVKDLQNQLRTAETKAKGERDRLNLEKEEFARQIQRLVSKENQFKHELRSKDVQIQKLSEAIRQKSFENKKQLCESLAPVQQNAQFKFSRISGESDFHLMVSQDQEKLFAQMSYENSQLKDALRLLQKELLDIVQLKQDVYRERRRLEGLDTENELQHEIQAIRDELFSTAFDESGQELITKFKQNLSRLREFMGTANKEDASEFSDIPSVHQLKLLLKNYDALVEGQNQLLTQSMQKMQKVPQPCEIAATFSRF